MSIVLSAKVADECVEASENRVIGSSGHQVIGKAKAKSKLLMLRNGSGDSVIGGKDSKDWWN